MSISDSALHTLARVVPKSSAPKRPRCVSTDATTGIGIPERRDVGRGCFCQGAFFELQVCVQVDLSRFDLFVAEP